MLIVLFRAIILYVVINICMRLMGKRQLAELQPEELVITILISNVVSLPLEDTSMPMVLGIIPVLTLVFFEVILSNVFLKSKTVRNIFWGKPVVVISKGEIIQKNLKKIRFSVDDLFASLRQAGYFDLNDVYYAIVETTGKLSVMPVSERDAITPKTVGIPQKTSLPPSVVISDGILISYGLKQASVDADWIERVLAKEKMKLKEVFIMTANEKKNYTIIKKEEHHNNEKHIG